MKRSELIVFLNNLGVNKARYSFDKIKTSDCISILCEGEVWNVYYTERDKPELIASFENENKANLFVANEFRRQM